MTISYNAIRGSKNLTMPSVVSWGTNNNILKDPPKSITTRKINKVGDNMDIINMQDESGDRINEYVKVYSRSLNPSVSVSYSNHGSNGGQKLGTYLGGRMASLPYKIAVDGDVRVPGLQTAMATLATSKMSRTIEAMTNPVIMNQEAKVYNDISKVYEDCVDDSFGYNKDGSRESYSNMENEKISINIKLDEIASYISKLRQEGNREQEIRAQEVKQLNLEQRLFTIQAELQSIYTGCKKEGELDKYCQSTKIDHSQLKRGIKHKIKVDGLVKSNINNNSNPGAQESRMNPVYRQIQEAFRPNHLISSGKTHFTQEGQNKMNHHVSSSINTNMLEQDVNINKGSSTYLKEGFVKMDTDIYVDKNGENVQNTFSNKTDSKGDRMFLLDGDTSGNITKEQALHYKDQQTGKAFGHVGGDYIHDELSFETNRPYFKDQQTTKASGHVGGDYIHDDIRLQNNRPNVENKFSGKSVTYIGGDYIHDDINLETNRPNVENQFSSKCGEYTKNLRHNNKLQFKNNIPIVNVKSAFSDMTGAETEKSSRKFNLPDTLPTDNFDIPKNLQKEVLDKPQKIASNFLDKSRVGLRESANNARNDR